MGYLEKIINYERRKNKWYVIVIVLILILFILIFLANYIYKYFYFYHDSLADFYPQETVFYAHVTLDDDLKSFIDNPRFIDSFGKYFIDFNYEKFFSLATKEVSFGLIQDQDHFDVLLATYIDDESAAESLIKEIETPELKSSKYFDNKVVVFSSKLNLLWQKKLSQEFLRTQMRGLKIKRFYFGSFAQIYLSEDIYPELRTISNNLKTSFLFNTLLAGADEPLHLKISRDKRGISIWIDNTFQEETRNFGVSPLLFEYLPPEAWMTYQTRDLLTSFKQWQSMTLVETGQMKEFFDHYLTQFFLRVNWSVDFGQLAKDFSGPAEVIVVKNGEKPSFKDLVVVFSHDFPAFNQVEKPIREFLARVYPTKQEKTLPDQTSIMEFVADSSVFKIEKIEINDLAQFSLYRIELPETEVALYLGYSADQVLITLDPANLSKLFSVKNSACSKFYSRQYQEIFFINPQLGKNQYFEALTCLMVQNKGDFIEINLKY